MRYGKHWKSSVTGAVDEYLFGEIAVNLLPAGEYTFYLLASAPPGSPSFYYLWSTWMEITESGLVWNCCPEHGILQGILYVHIDEGSVMPYSNVHTAIFALKLSFPYLIEQ